MSDALHAAALPVNGLTAYQAIHDLLTVQKGETLLITGAAGGTGTFAVQRAARVGAHVIVTARREDHPYLRKLGATELIDYTQADFVDVVHAAHPKGIDAVLDCVGGETAARSLKVVREGGGLLRLLILSDTTFYRRFVSVGSRQLSHPPVKIATPSSNISDSSRSLMALPMAGAWSKGKPAPDIFVYAAGMVGVYTPDCLGIEDAAAGVEAIKAAGMRAIGIGPRERFHGADAVLPSLANLHLA